MNKIVCFGELLLRMSPDAQGNWLRSGSMPVYVGGAELNVAAALANWKLPVKYCTALPDNVLSDNLYTYLRERKIDDSTIQKGGSRIGTYYMPQGSDLKHAAVIYDRANSAFSQLQPGMINWDDVFEDSNWFHFSAITPSLNENTVAVCKEALKVATQKKLTISVDLNYRAKLWQWGKKPIEVMPELVDYCHIIMGNIWSAEVLLGIPFDADIHARGAKKDYLEQALQTAQSIFQQYRNCRLMAQTFRFDEDAGIRYYGAVDTREKQYVSKEFCSKKINDKAGSGDCFMAGIIYGLQQKHILPTIVDFAAAAAFGKLHETGDSTRQSITDVQNIITNGVCK